MSIIEETNLFSIAEENNNYDDYESLEIISCNYISSSRQNWQLLFEGYDELYAITFSSGIDFTAKLLNKFEYAEIIYGCPDIINSQIATIIAAQRNIIETISKSKAVNSIAEKVGNGQLRLFVSMDTNSHEKIFILKSKTGRTRVITGSANMSASAFNGVQREEIMCFDDYDAFDYFFNRFDRFKSKCSNRIEDKTIKAIIADKSYLKEHIEDTPYLDEANKKIQIDITRSDDDIDYIADVKNIEKEIKDLLPRVKTKSSVISVTADIVNVIRRNNRDYIDKSKREKQSPILHLDLDKETLSFNNKEINLNPSKEQIETDAISFTNFVDGFSKFNGNYKAAQKDYFAYMNWFFASVFIPELRLIADRNRYSIFYFPVFGILCGPSNAGKTKLVEMLSKLMTGVKINSYGNDIFSYRELDKLRKNCEGTPIMIEDLAKTQYENNYEKIIKNDQFGMMEGNVNFPVVSITANKIQSITQDVTKRAVYFRTDISTDKETGAKNAKLVNDNINAASNSLFGEYVRRMIPIVKEMENTMMNGVVNYSPDILNKSSVVLVDIFRENSIYVPDYVRPLTYSDYFGDEVVGRTAIERIKNAWKNQKDNFSINKKDNTVKYTIPDSASYEIAYLVNELPSSLNAKKFGGTLVMDLDVAKKVFGIDFKKRLFE